MYRDDVIICDMTAYKTETTVAAAVFIAQLKFETYLLRWKGKIAII